MNLKLIISVLLANLTPCLFLIVAYLKRKEATYWYAISLGILFLIINLVSSVVMREFVEESELFRKSLGAVFTAVFRDWHFAYYYLLLILGFVLMIVRRKSLLD